MFCIFVLSFTFLFFSRKQKLLEAPFTVYVVKQRKGDFVIVPPDCAHQVINQVSRIHLFFNFKETHVLKKKFLCKTKGRTIFQICME